MGHQMNRQMIIINSFITIQLQLMWPDAIRTSLEPQSLPPLDVKACILLQTSVDRLYSRRVKVTLHRSAAFICQQTKYFSLIQRGSNILHIGSTSNCYIRLYALKIQKQWDYGVSLCCLGNGEPGNSVLRFAQYRLIGMQYSRRQKYSVRTLDRSLSSNTWKCLQALRKISFRIS